MNKKGIISTVLPADREAQLRLYADMLSDGNVSEMVRRLICSGLDQVAAMNQSGVLRVAVFFKNLFGRKHSRLQAGRLSD
jgi:predicted SnoaL-like aldol condensation-catalyzing enzyme